MSLEWNVTTSSAHETRQLGRRLGELAKPGDVILLNGDLGVGKTHFAKGVAAGLGIDGPVTSPTFTLIAEYEGRLPMTHMDLYRLYRDPSSPTAVLVPQALLDISFDDYLDDHGVLLIEWPRGVIDLLDGYLWVELRYAGSFDAATDSEDAREVFVQPRGTEAAVRMGEWVRAWG